MVILRGQGVIRIVTEVLQPVRPDRKAFDAHMALHRLAALPLLVIGEMVTGRIGSAASAEHAVIRFFRFGNHHLVVGPIPFFQPLLRFAVRRMGAEVALQRRVLGVAFLAEVALDHFAAFPLPVVVVVPGQRERAAAFAAVAGPRGCLVHAAEFTHLFKMRK